MKNILLNILSGTIALLLFTISPNYLNSQTTIQGSFNYDGLLRTYRLYIPAVYSPDQPAPLVLNLHGYGSNAAEQEFYGDFRPIADTAGFLLVHPNGTTDAGGSQFWNTFGNSSVDDAGFLSALIDTINKSYPINPARVYSTGMSNGGFMSFSLACSLSDRIAAIASVTGTMIISELNACNPQRSVPIMQIHGTSDGVVPYNGNILFVPVADLNDFWIDFNNCNTVPVVTELPDIDPDDGCTAEHYLWQGGDSFSTVEHFKVIGGGHSWPGAPVIVDITNMDFSASEEIWRFFSQYDLDGLITDIEPVHSQSDHFSVSPNPTHGPATLSFSKAGIKNITILDAAGKIINKFTTGQSTLPIQLEQKGLYLIIVEENGEIVTQKLMKL
jgi:polyhydroxybutyrate depolymerase